MHSPSPKPGQALALASVLSLVAEADGQSVKFAWDRHETHGPEITFEVFWGPGSRNYTGSGDAGTNLTFTRSGLVPGVTNFYAVVARNPEGLMSDFSNELSYAAPVLPKLSIERTLLSTVVLTVKGKAGDTVAIEASEYPAGSPWAKVFEGTIPESGQLTFVEASNLRSRFYRAQKL